jgi:hypothetical protein
MHEGPGLWAPRSWLTRNANPEMSEDPLALHSLLHLRSVSETPKAFATIRSWVVPSSSAS